MSRRDIEPNETGLLDVGDGHEVHWETWGAPNGIPVVFVHGGPGGGCSPGHREMFDPERFLVVFFDQRGCGRSRPLAREPDADLTANTTHHLIRDMERIREHVGIDKWAVYGLSWGTTLGLAYAEAHPDRVIGVMLGLVGLSTRREVAWITEGVARIFAPEWDRFASFVPTNLAGIPLVDAYARLVFDEDPEVRAAAAHQWCVWEDTHMGLAPGAGPRLQLEDPGFKLEFARLVTHYWSNGAFLGETELMDHAALLGDIPGVLVHGRYDVSSPIETPWRLSQAWDAAELVVVDDAGHGGGSLIEAFTRGLERVTS
ncbi:MAG: prolyl aminopeptidase [Acidimicrobiia bacterium]